MDGFVLVLFDVMHDHGMACMSYDGVSCDIMEILKNIKNVENPFGPIGFQSGLGGENGDPLNVSWGSALELLYKVGKGVTGKLCISTRKSRNMGFEARNHVFSVYIYTFEEALRKTFILKVLVVEAYGVEIEAPQQ